MRRVISTAIAIGLLFGRAQLARADECRVLNLPRLAPKPSAERQWIGDHGLALGRAGVAWFGRFDKNANYAELRAAYDDEGIVVHVHVADLFVWWALTDGPQWGGQLIADPEKWDALELAFEPEPGVAPSARALRVLVANYQYGDPVAKPETGEPHVATRTWSSDGSGWSLLDDPISAGRGWYHTVNSSWNADPGPSNNTTEFDNGTMYYVYVPWASLGYDSEPPSGTAFKLSARLHDIDDPVDADVSGGDAPSTKGSLEVGPLSDMLWPESAEPDDSATWATVVLNQKPYTPVAVQSETTIDIAPDDVATYRDVTVGGHAFIKDRWLEGGGADADYRWDNCMDTKFGTRPDLFVHPEGAPTHLCFFSRALLYWDFGTLLPASSVVTKAELRMFHFGGDSDEDPGDPNFEVQTSHVQVHRLEGAWLDLPLEQAVTWNTMPLAAENVGYGVITPDLPAGENGKYVSFDVTPLVARAVLRGEPLNLALYGADMTANTGKYLVSQEGGWEAANHALLTVTYGEAAEGAALPSAETCTLGVAAELFPTPGTGSPEGELAPLPAGGQGGAATGSGGVTSGSGGSSSSSGGAPGVAGNTSPAAGNGAAPAASADSDSGCGCRAAAHGSESVFGVALVFAAGLLQRRSRRSGSSASSSS